MRGARLSLLLILTACAAPTGRGDLPLTATPLPPPPTAAATPTVTAAASSTPLPSPSPSPTAACPWPEGQVLDASYPGAAVTEAVPVRVFLPPCYQATGDPYPVLFLLHGKPFDETQWENLGAFRLAGERMDAGSWPPFVMILPRLPEPLFSGTDGGPGSYEAEFLEGLLPFVEQEFRVRSDPAGRAIAGISRGGVWALEIGLSHPELIDAVGALSPSLAVNYPRPTYDPFTLARPGRALPARALLLAGEQDWARSDTQRLHAALVEAGVDAALLVVPGRHEEATWSGAMEAVLAFFAQGWRR